jgi:cellulose synthase/poly-beta-1,6-N-acetylglucosamine synthase-like glycosyltransferase
VVGIDGDLAGYLAADLAPPGRTVTLVPGDPPGGKAVTLNAAVRAASGEVLVFADTMQRFAPDAITQLAVALENARYAAVSGALEIGGGQGQGGLLGWYWRAEKALRAAEAELHSAIGVTGAIYAMRRDLWRALPAELILDDLYVPMRLILEGHRIGFAAKALALDERRTTPAQEFRRKVRTLTGILQLCAWLPGVLSPRKNPVWIPFVCHKLLRLLTPYCVAGVLLGTTGILLSRSSGVRVLGLIALLLALAMLAAPGGWARRLREGVVWGLVMQLAVVRASWYGLRGRWDVWGPSR